jgi:AbrB family looped-hinge helix DNA binding protein
MDEIITIDRAGRVVIPVHVRRRLHLTPGTRLRIRAQGSQIILDPLPPENRTEVKDGLLVVHRRLGGRDVDRRTVPMERLDRFTRGR